MKKSFMSNIKNFVDSNVRQRIDRVAHNSTEPSNDDLLLVERHFENIRQVCSDADKRISAMLLSIQFSSNPSHLSTYTQNVQAGLNNLSHNLSQAANLTSSAGNNSNSTTTSNQINDLVHQQSLSDSTNLKLAINCNQEAHAHRSNESLNNSVPNLELSQTTEQLSEDILAKHKKLPAVGFYKFLVKSANRLKDDSIFCSTLTQCSHIQNKLTQLYLCHERKIETNCLKPIRAMLENDIPSVVKLKKLYIKAHNDVEVLRSKHSVASHKQQQAQLQAGHFSNSSYLITQNNVQQNNLTKLELIKRELEDAIIRYGQAKDNYEIELYGFICREAELVDLLRTFYDYQSDYHKQALAIIQTSSPAFIQTSGCSRRRFAFGTQLDEHLCRSSREISPVIELCTHFLHAYGLKEEGLFRIPGSSIKIKKLKNAIDAGFLSLFELDDVGDGHKRHPCIIPLYELFCNTLGHHPLQREQSITPTPSNNQLKGSLAVDEANLNQTNYVSNCSIEAETTSNHVILDVHSIAGLLKLYLRELPEPLLTHSLYKEWIECISDKVASIDEKVNLLAIVIKKLPLSNYANLRHLIKFLYILTLHQDQNKMTSTNLAIAMAPSLIWAKPSKSESASDTPTSTENNAQSLNLQMCTFGLSASLHAMLLEALINHSHTLFPEPADFSLSGLTDLTFYSKTRDHVLRNGRAVKSTSPTGLSTASSSSFSSNASYRSANQADNKGHRRKSGSMDGLLGGQEIDTKLQDLKIEQQGMIGSSATNDRPVSVHIQRAGCATIPQQPEQDSSNSTTSRKPPAPPVPPPTSVRHQQERLKAEAASVNSTRGNQLKQKPPRPVSLRGTGTIGITSQSESLCNNSASMNYNNIQAYNTARPKVPPPDRPMIHKKPLISAMTVQSIERSCQDLDVLEKKTVTCSTSSTPDETNLDDNTNQQPLSLNSTNISMDDSSFEDDSDRRLSRDETDDLQQTTDHKVEPSMIISKEEGTSITNEGKISDAGKGEVTKDDAKCSELNLKLSNDKTLNRLSELKENETPVKPSRSYSPKLAQSTPL